MCPLPCETKHWNDLLHLFMYVLGNRYPLEGLKRFVRYFFELVSECTVDSSCSLEDDLTSSPTSNIGGLTTEPERTLSVDELGPGFSLGDAMEVALSWSSKSSSGSSSL